MIKPLPKLLKTYKISNLDPKDHKTQSENFRRFIFTLAKDARVILIAFADRLEVMRSLSTEPSDIQLKRSWKRFTYTLH